MLVIIRDPPLHHLQRFPPMMPRDKLSEHKRGGSRSLHVKSLLVVARALRRYLAELHHLFSLASTAGFSVDYHGGREQRRGIGAGRDGGRGSHSPTCHGQDCTRRGDHVHRVRKHPAGKRLHIEQCILQDPRSGLGNQPPARNVAAQIEDGGWQRKLCRRQQNKLPADRHRGSEPLCFEGQQGEDWAGPEAAQGVCDCA
jgi:hypothetical protein